MVPVFTAQHTMFPLRRPFDSIIKREEEEKNSENAFLLMQLLHFRVHYLICFEF